MKNYIILLIYAIINVVYAENCTCCISENYFNESIMYQHISLLDIEPSIYQPLLYKYDIITDTCDENIMVYVDIYRYYDNIFLKYHLGLKNSNL